MVVRKVCLTVISPYETLRSTFKITFVIEPDSDLCLEVPASGYVVVVSSLSPEGSPFTMPLACVSHLCERTRSFF